MRINVRAYYIYQHEPLILSINRSKSDFSSTFFYMGAVHNNQGDGQETISISINEYRLYN